MVTVAELTGKTDSERIEDALQNRDPDGVVVIPPKADGGPWLLDQAILLYENTTVIVRNCTLKLSDACRDNFFRTANCGLGIEDPEPIRNVHIRGEGKAVLEGADRPRATGDGSKLLKNPCPHLRAPYLTEASLALADWIPEERKRSGELTVEDRHGFSFGTDCGKEGESQKGDWRGVGVLLANVEDFSVEGLTIVKSHGWGISIEAGVKGRICRIAFDSCMSREIDGVVSNMENQDGIDIRNGCREILISDITGQTGDDVVALTAIARKNGKPGGSLETTHVMHGDWSRRESGIRDITVRNVVATSYCCWLVRLLAVGTKIENVIVDTVVDTAKTPSHGGAILLGENDGEYGVNEPDSIDAVVISNVIANGKTAAVEIRGWVANSVITNIINRNPAAPCVHWQREKSLNNVTVQNAVSAR